MRVVIAEDSVLLREGLSRLLAEAGHDVVAAAGQAEEFLRAVGEHEPDAVVVDVRMPPTFTDEGLRAALVVRSRWPGVGVLVLSQYVEERYATELLSDRPHGVGYLLKDRVADLAEFLEALDRVAAGGSALDPEVVAQLLARSRHPLASLTPRERDVLALMAEGRTLAYDITAPAGLPLTVSDGSGDLNASGFGGHVTLSSGGGDITASRLSGAIELASGGGDITAAGLGGSVRLSDGAGNIVVTGLAATDVVGDNGSGNITLTFTKVPRQVNVTDESGNITLVLPRGPTYYHVDTSSESGNTSVSVNHRLSSPYVIIASNGSGNITISY